MYKVWRDGAGQVIGYCDDSNRDFLPGGSDLIISTEDTKPLLSVAIDNTPLLATNQAYLEAPEIPQWFKTWLSTCYESKSLTSTPTSVSPS